MSQGADRRSSLFAAVDRVLAGRLAPSSPGAPVTRRTAAVLRAVNAGG